MKNRFEQSAPLPLIAMLLIAAMLVIEQPTVRVALLLLALLIVVTVGIWPLMRRWRGRGGVRRPRRVLALWCLLGVIGVAGFGAMLATRPTLRTTYPAAQFVTAPGIAEQRGFYPPDTDTAGNQYVWTRDRGTLVFGFLVRKPVTFTLALRSAAIAGGPDAPVTVEVNGTAGGIFRPDPKDPQFQTFTLRLVPYDWGGERTEVRLLTETFMPGKSDTRTLGTMVQSIAVDTTEAWAGVGRRLWLLWAIPACALLACALPALSRLLPSPRAYLMGYGALAACALGAGCAVALIALLVRIGVIERDTYYVWLMALCFFAACFFGALLTLPLGAWGAASVLTRARQGIAASRLRALPDVVAAWVNAKRAPLPDEPEPSRRALACDLALLLVLAFGVRLLWVVLVPPWQAPDEPDHYSYVTQLVEQGRVPQTIAPDYPPFSTELMTSWKYSLLGDISSLGRGEPPQLAHLPVNFDYAVSRAYEAPREERRSGAAGAANPHPPLYYLIGAVPYALLRDAPIFSRMYAVRGASAALGALSCVFSYLFAFELRRSRRWGWALGCCMALLPMYAFITATVNNDVGMDCAGAALIWLVVRAWKRDEFSPRLALALGIAAGCALLTKATVYPIVLIAGIAVFAKTVQTWRASREHAARHAAALGLFAAPVAAFYLPWLFLQYHVAHQIKIITIPLAPLFRWLTGMVTAAAGGTDSVAIARSDIRFSLWDYLRFEQGRGGTYFDNLFIKDMWGVFGWLDVTLADPFYTAIAIFVIIGLIGSGAQIVGQARRRHSSLLLAGIVLAHVAFLFVVIDWFISYANSGHEFGLQGRYFFPVLAPALYLLLSGWEYLCGENGIALRLAPFAMALLQVVAVGTIIARYYGVVFG